MNSIVYVVSTFNKSGPSNQLYNIIKNLDRQTFDPSVITLSPEPENSMLEKFKALDCALYSLNYNRVQGFLYAKKKLQSLFEKIKPGIVHTSGIRGDIICQKITDKKKHILSIRNFPSEDYITKYGLIQGNLLSFTHFHIIEKAEYAIACSKRLSHKFAQKKDIHLRFIQNGVDTDEFTPVKNITEKNRLKKKYGYNPSDHLIIIIGTLIPRKNITTVIKAFMLNQSSDYRLLIAGDGNERTKLEKQAHKDSRIRFFGYIHNVVEFLQMSDFLVSSSFSEGLPNSIMEAMACGVPVILSDIEAHKELMETSKWSRFFKPDDITRLLMILNSLHTDNWNTLSLEMKRIIHTHFTAGMMSKNYQKLYKEIL